MLKKRQRKPPAEGLPRACYILTSGNLEKAYPTEEAAMQHARDTLKQDDRSDLQSLTIWYAKPIHIVLKTIQEIRVGRVRQAKQP